MNIHRLLVVLTVVGFILGLQPSSFALEPSSTGEKLEYMMGNCEYGRNGEKEPKALTDLLAAKATIMTGYTWTVEKLLSKKIYKAYIVAVPTEAVAEFNSQGFKPLPENTYFSLKVYRISQLPRFDDDYRLNVKPEYEKVSRKAVVDYQMDKSNYAASFKMIQRLNHDPKAALKEMSEKHFNYLTTAKRVITDEESYHLIFEIKVSYNSMRDNGHVYEIFSSCLTTGSFATKE